MTIMFSGIKKTNGTPPNKSLSPKAAREQAALKQGNHCYLCGKRKEKKENNWLDKLVLRLKPMLSAVLAVLLLGHVQWMNYR
ncbi:hypothetical protein PTW35_25415 (plasmid) [Photobacterium sp. DA100]|uniref:hypothetical protein n=1 Tax=Photobacterium sp. DA100 TaxID=3027472 RepID=UPI00247A3BEA|nr:hypothetical protein [Photobacterium sp. DA100]WEM44604.1 hypothetical protein PTW35_25415 [Photobacterium sp. DA100]